MAEGNCAAPAIGIDLGTTFCCVGVYIDGQAKIIPNLESGDLITPSYVFFEEESDDVVGNPAKANAFRFPENTVFDVKRILGREFKDPDLVNDMTFWPFTVKEDEGVPKVLVNGKPRYPEEISAKLLAKLKKFAERYLKLKPGSIKKAVITVPAYFHDGQRQATVDAGELAGLEVLTILNEPTAAAIAYSLERRNTKPKKILVYDLGGGTFDVAVLNMEPNKIEVLGVNGDTHLGGEDFDRKMMEYCASRFKTATGIDLLDGKDSADSKIRENCRRNLRRLQTYCENAKMYLTTGKQTKVSVDSLVNGNDLVVDITRAQFEEMNKRYFYKTIHLVDSILEELGLSKYDIDEIVLVGGSSRIPKIQELLTNYFDGKSLSYSIHADQAVACGAAIHAAALIGDKSLGHNKITKLQDVTPLPLGIEADVDCKLAVIIPKNTRVPTRITKGFQTPRDYCTEVDITIYQGNDLSIAKNNRQLAKFKLGGIPSNKKGEEKLDVTMEINKMGILHVETICTSNQKGNSLTITENKNGMSKATKLRILFNDALRPERLLEGFFEDEDLYAKPPKLARMGI